ncbi:MAG: glycosyltransferase [Caldilineales bacterium]|nr:glycosyltransferase [Caldilineales bacterium]
MSPPCFPLRPATAAPASTPTAASCCNTSPASNPRSLTTLSSTTPPTSLPGIDLHRAPAASQRPLLRILWEQIALPLAARRRQIDLFHGLAYALPLAAGLPGVVTVHDLSFLLFPHSFGPGNRLYLSRITALSCRRARKVIAVSQATCDVQRLLGVGPTASKSSTTA